MIYVYYRNDVQDKNKIFKLEASDEEPIKIRTNEYMVHINPETDPRNNKRNWIYVKGEEGQICKGKTVWLTVDDVDKAKKCFDDYDMKNFINAQLRVEHIAKRLLKEES